MKTEEKEEKKLSKLVINEEREILPLLKKLGIALISFSLSQLSCLGSISPFCVAFSASVDFEDGAVALVGGIVGYFLSFDWKTALRYSASLLLCALCRFVLEKKFPLSLKSFVCPVVALCSCLAPAVVSLSVSSGDVFSWLFALCEAALAFCGVYLFIRALRTPVGEIGLGNLSVFDSGAIGLCLCVLFLCASGLSVGPVAPARVLGVVLLLFVAHYKGAKAAALFGVCAAASFSVPAQTRFLFPIFSLSSVVCGMFSSFGQYAVSLSFAVTSLTLGFLNGFSEKSFWCLLEIAAGCAVFAVIPSKKLFEIHAELEKGFLAPDDRLNRRVSASLQRAAETVNEVSSIVTNVSSRLDNVINPEIDRIFAKLQQNICFGCSFKNECWSERFSETSADILAITGLKERKKEQTELEKRCPRASALVSQVNQSYGDFVTSLASKMKVREMRGIVSDQFSSIAQFLSRFAEQISESRVVDTVRSRTLRRALSEAGVFVDTVNFFNNPNGRVTVEVGVTENAFELDLKKMRVIFEHAASRSFEKPEIAITELQTLITFEEKAVFKVLSGSCQIPFGENTVCGDCIGRLRDLGGNEIALISDGMGTGSRAAVDSVLTATLMEKLLSCSFSFESALKTVNCALMVKSTDESISTVDGVSVNVFSGQADFFKAGAAVSFLRRRDKVTLIEEQSLPVGIIRNVCFAHREARLEEGDIILLVSDGVTVGDCGWICDELLAWSTNNMDDLASHIASLSRLRATKETEDDITVVALKLFKN